MTRIRPGMKTAAQLATDPALGAAFGLTDPAVQVLSPDGVSAASPWQQVANRSLRPPSKVISRFASGHGWTGGTDDLTTRLYGDRSYKGVSNGAGGSLYLSAPATGLFATPQDWSTSIIRVVVQIDDPTKVQTFQVNVGMGTGNSAAAGVPGTQIAGEWGIFTVPRSAFAVTAGTLNWAGVTGVNVRFQDKSTGAITVRLAAVELIPDLATTYPNGVFVMEADDGYAGQFTNLLPVVSARGIPITYNIISDRFTGSPTASGYAPADLRRLQDKHGWQVSCHAYAQADHNGPSTAGQMEASFARQKQWLHANGLHSGVDHLALCPGTGSPVAEGAMLDAIRRSFRSVRVNSGFYETASPGDPLRLRSILFSGAGNSVANLQTNINAVAGAGGALIFTVHDILPGATDGTSNSLPAQAATNLATVLDYAASKGMAFRTRADWLDGR